MPLPKSLFIFAWTGNCTEKLAECFFASFAVAPITVNEHWQNEDAEK